MVIYCVISLGKSEDDDLRKKIVPDISVGDADDIDDDEDDIGAVHNEDDDEDGNDDTFIGDLEWESE